MILLLVFRGRHIPHLQEHFQTAHQILHTLRDDTGRKGRVVGWLDLTGPRRKEKIVRTARTYSGRRKVYYRDPWFRVKFKLADGNLLHLILEDKVKTKPGSFVHQTQCSAKLVVNPNLYRLGEVPSSAVPLTNAALAHEDGVFVVKTAGPAKNLSAQEVLKTLKAVYSHLEPIGSELQLADIGTATEA
jgi:hypothetical protein